MLEILTWLMVLLMPSFISIFYFINIMLPLLLRKGVRKPKKNSKIN